ncbi:hypothetical protein HRI_000129900 [Hibiscus trionum]|uniref:Retrotransposon gag domain-containing protein n=1 Tax=Hibiscus trionum TaxID=183268 RepID=A0A9W7GTH6_HIBTR|nr:hypothetical protein HRI_000129900 [Hibiscus trionum]
MEPRGELRGNVRNMVENEIHDNVENLPPPSPLGCEGARAGAGVGDVRPQASQGQVDANMTSLIYAIVGAFQAVIVGMHVAAPQPSANVGLPLERLRSLGGTEFQGLSPGSSEAWFESTRRILGQMSCNDVRKFGCVVSLLHGDAYTWWMTITTGMEPVEVTWAFFGNAFKKKYLCTRYLDEKKREFMSLVQGNTTVF